MMAARSSQEDKLAASAGRGSWSAMATLLVIAIIVPGGIAMILQSRTFTSDASATNRQLLDAAARSMDRIATSTEQVPEILRRQTSLIQELQARDERHADRDLRMAEVQATCLKILQQLDTKTRERETMPSPKPGSG